MKFKWKHSFHNRNTLSSKEEELHDQTKPLSSAHTSTKEMEIATTTSTQLHKEKTEEVQPEEEEQEKEFTRSTSFTKRYNTNDSNRISVNNNRYNNKSSSLPQLVTTSHPLLSSLHQTNKMNEMEESETTKKEEEELQEKLASQKENNSKQEEEQEEESSLHTPPRLSAEYTEPSRESSVRKTKKKSRKDKDSDTKKSSTILALKSLFGVKIAKIDEEKSNEDKDKNLKVKREQSYRSTCAISGKQAVQTLPSKMDVPCKILEIESTLRDTADASIDQIDQLLHHRLVAGLIPRELHGQPQPSSQSIEVASGKNVSENVNISNAFSATSSSMFNLFPSSDGVCHEAKSVSGSQVCVMPSVTRTTSHSISNELADSSVNGSHPSLRHVISLTDPRLRRTSRFLASQRDAAHNARQRAISWDGMRKTNEQDSSMHAYTVGKQDAVPWKRSLPDLSHTGQILKSTKTRDEKAQNYVHEKTKNKSSYIKEEQVAGNLEMERLQLHWSSLHKADSNSTTKPQNEKNYNVLVQRKEEQEEELPRHHREHHDTKDHDIVNNNVVNDDKSAKLNNSLCNECNIDTPKNESSRRYHLHHHHQHNHKLASSLSYSASSTLPTTIFASLISPNSLLQSPTSGTGNTDDESSQSKSNAINLAKVTQETKQKSIQSVSSPPQAKSIALPDSTTKTKATTSKIISNANTVPLFTSTQTTHHEVETKSSCTNFEREFKLLSSLTGTLESAVNYAEEMRQERVAFTAEQWELIDKLNSYVTAEY